MFEPPSATPVPRPSATPVVNAEPVGALSIECEDLAAPELIAAVLGAPLAPVGKTGLPGISFAIPDASIVQDGGLLCRWSRPDVEDTYFEYPSLTVKALSDAADLYKRNWYAILSAPEGRTPYFRVDLFDAAAAACSGGWTNVDAADEPIIEYWCTWQVLADDVWLEVSIDHLPASAVRVQLSDTLAEEVTPILDGSPSLALLNSMVASIRASDRLPRAPALRGLPECADFAPALSPHVERWDDATQSMVPVEVVDSSLTLEDLTESSVPTLRDASHGLALGGWGFRTRYPWADMSRFSFERLGFRDCEVNVTVVSPYSGSDEVWLVDHFYVTRGLDWLVAAPNPTPYGDRVEVEGLGVLFDAYCLNEESCSDMMLSGDVLIGFPYGDERGRIIDKWRAMMAIISAD